MTDPVVVPIPRRKLRVLLVVEGCNPDMVSVPLVGWSHAMALRARSDLDVHIVTQVRNAWAMGRAGLKQGVDFTAIDTEWVSRWVYRLAAPLGRGKGKGWTTLAVFNTLAYTQFERLLWRAVGPRVRAGEFDLVHRIIPLSPTTASPTAAKCRRAGVPYVMGPVNGGVPWPRQFDAARRAEAEWLSPFRWLYQLRPSVHRTRRAAAAILVASRDAWAQHAAKLRAKMFYAPENAIDPARFPPAPDRTFPADRPLRVVFVGRLVPYKGADMLLEAAAPLVRGGQVHLTIAGRGPEAEPLKRRAAELGLEAGFDMPGWVAHTAVAQTFAAADVFAFPSVREFGGGVVLEAMAVGTVPIVVDYAGPAELVTPGTGYLVPLGTRAEIVGRFRSHLTALAADRTPLVAKSRLAVRRVREQFTWEARAEQSVQVYRWVLGERLKPDFPMPTPDPA